MNYGRKEGRNESRKNELRKKTKKIIKEKEKYIEKFVKIHKYRELTYFSNASENGHSCNIVQIPGYVKKHAISSARRSFGRCHVKAW